MSSSLANVATLRQLLAERFPTATRGAARVLATGVSAIDERLGGLPCGAPTEVVATAPSCGGALLLGELLGVVRRSAGRVALVDSHDSFDPESCEPAWLQSLVWVRCRETAAALQAADILVRDANLQLVILDLRRALPGELRKTPASFWYRLQRAVEPSDLALVVLTPQAVVASARLRLRLERSGTLAALEATRPELAGGWLCPVVQRQRVVVGA